MVFFFLQQMAISSLMMETLSLVLGNNDSTISLCELDIGLRERKHIDTEIET